MVLVGILTWIIFAGLAFFAAAAIYYCAQLRPEIRSIFSAAATVGIFGPVLFLLELQDRLIFSAPTLILFWGWYFSIKPKQDAPWLKDVLVLPSVEVQGDNLTVRNIRNFHYRSDTDFDVRYYDKVFDLSQIRTVDLFLCYWGTTAVAHTIMSFGFSNGDHLAISIETRKEIGEKYSPVKGFFKTFELIYVIADERDVVGVRVNQRNEDVYLYRLKPDAGRVKNMLLDYIKTIDQLEKSPAFYNALTTNCTTSILPHIRAVLPQFKFNFAILANGYIDRWRYDSGIWGFDLPFEEFRRTSRINDKVKQAIDSPDFSARIREGLPSIRGNGDDSYYSLPT